MEVIFKTDNLSKRYGTQLALNHLNMMLYRKDIYGFVGKNGAGKSTLMKLILGLSFPTKGDFTLFGISNKDKNITEVCGRMSGIVEMPAFYPHMTAFENLKTQAILSGIQDQKEIVNALSSVGLENDRKKKVKNFSLGMKQRLGLARALLTKAEFIILDEPTNGLDPEGIIELRNLITKLNQENNITFLISSHYISELEHIITRLGIINNGTMLKELNMDELRIQNPPCTQIEVSNVEEARELLLGKFPNLHIKCEIDKISVVNGNNLSKEICSLLTSNQITVMNITNATNSLENYVMQMIGNANSTKGR